MILWLASAGFSFLYFTYPHKYRRCPMHHTYLSLLVALKDAKAEKSSEDFVNYLMLKYAAREPLYDAIKDWHPYFIDEDKEMLDIILTETKWQI